MKCVLYNMLILFTAIASKLEYVKISQSKGRESSITLVEEFASV